MSPRTPSASHTGTDTVSTAGESIRPRVGDVQGRAFEFNPPAMIRWYTCFKDQVQISRSLSTNSSAAAHPLCSQQQVPSCIMAPADLLLGASLNLVAASCAVLHAFIIYATICALKGMMRLSSLPVKLC